MGTATNPGSFRDWLAPEPRRTHVLFDFLSQPCFTCSLPLFFRLSRALRFSSSFFLMPFAFALLSFLLLLLLPNRYNKLRHEASQLLHPPFTERKYPTPALLRRRPTQTPKVEPTKKNDAGPEIKITYAAFTISTNLQRNPKNYTPKITTRLTTKNNKTITLSTLHGLMIMDAWRCFLHDTTLYFTTIMI